jgi:hypothetical protein
VTDRTETALDQDVLKNETDDSDASETLHSPSSMSAGVSVGELLDADDVEETIPMENPILVSSPVLDTMAEELPVVEEQPAEKQVTETNKASETNSELVVEVVPTAQAESSAPSAVVEVASEPESQRRADTTDILEAAPETLASSDVVSVGLLQLAQAAETTEITTDLVVTETVAVESTADVGEGKPAAKAKAAPKAKAAKTDKPKKPAVAKAKAVKTAKPKAVKSTEKSEKAKSVKEKPEKAEVEKADGEKPAKAEKKPAKAKTTSGTKAKTSSKSSKSSKSKAGSKKGAAKAGEPADDDEEGKRKLGMRGAAPWAARHAAKHAAEAKARSADPPPPGSARATIRTPDDVDSLKARIVELHNCMERVKSLRKNLAKNFYEIGEILIAIGTQELYRAKGFPSLEAWVDREVDLSKSIALRMARIPTIFQKEAAQEFGLDKLNDAMNILDGIQDQSAHSGNSPPLPSARVPLSSAVRGPIVGR